MLKVLITGSSGFVGKHLQQFLNQNVSAFGKYDVMNFDLTLGLDVRKFEEVRAAVDQFQPDLIFHLAAQAFVPETTMNPHRGFETNLIGTLNILEAVRQTGMHSRIHISGTSEEYGYDRPDASLSEHSVAIPTTPYGVSKLAATTLSMTYARLYGINVVVTRAWNHIGPGASPSYAVSAFAKRVAEAEKYGTVLVHGNLSAVRNYTDVRDIVRAYAMAINLPTGIYNLASDQTLSIKDVLGNLLELTNKKIETQENSHLFRSMSDYFPSPDSTKFRSLTGWKAEFELTKTLQDTLDYWRELV